jgi:hypothetical protein
MVELLASNQLRDALMIGAKGFKRLNKELIDQIVPLIEEQLSQNGDVVSFKAIHPDLLGKGSLALSESDFDMVVWLGAAVSVLVDFLEGAMVPALVQCAIALWVYRRKAIRLSEKETIVLVAAKQISKESSTEGPVVTQDIVERCKSIGWDASASEVTQVLQGLQKKRNGYQQVCEIIRSAGKDESDKWFIMDY